MPTELEWDDVFEEQLANEQARYSSIPEGRCAWCGNLLRKEHISWLPSAGGSRTRFCSHDHAIEWNDDRRRKFPGRQERPLRREKGDSVEHREEQRAEALTRETALVLSQRDGKAILCKKGYCVATPWETWPIPRHIVAVLLRIMAGKFDQAKEEDGSDDNRA